MSRFWYLASKKIAGEATDSELEELEILLKEDPDLSRSIEIQETYFNKKSLLISTEEINQKWEHLQFEVNKKKRPTLILKLIKYKVAASIAILVLVSLIFIVSKKNNIPVEIATKTSTDKIKKILPDGSVVWLNVNSSLTYDNDFNKKNRKVILNGEAFFDVVHNSDLPFYVHAGEVVIKVKGTAFDVRNYHSEKMVIASLLRGSIELSTQDRSDKILMRPNEKVIVKRLLSNITKEHRTDIEKSTLSEQGELGTVPEIAWVENKIVFSEKRLADLVKDLELKYHTQIIIQDTFLENQKFTGAFDKESIEEALTALQFTYKFNYKIENNKVVISKQ